MKNNVFTDVLCWFNLHKWVAWNLGNETYHSCGWCGDTDLTAKRYGRPRVRGGLTLFLLGICIGILLTMTKHPPFELPLIVGCLALGAAIGGAIGWWKGLRNSYTRAMAKEFMNSIMSKKPK